MLLCLQCSTQGPRRDMNTCLPLLLSLLPLQLVLWHLTTSAGN